MDTSSTSPDDGHSREQQKKGGGKVKGKMNAGPPFSLKKWNAVAMWQWDVECDTCAICRVQVMGELMIPAPLYYQSTNPQLPFFILYDTI